MTTIRESRSGEFSPAIFMVVLILIAIFVGVMLWKIDNRRVIRAIESPGTSIKVSVQLTEDVKLEYRAAMEDLLGVFANELANALDRARRTGQKDWIKVLEYQVAGLKDNVDLTRRILMIPKDIQIPKVSKGNHRPH